MGNARTNITDMHSDNERKTVYNQQDFGRAEGKTRKAGTLPGGMSFSYEEVEMPVIMEKPLVGFLVSISRTMEGEFWPIRLGENVIGAASDCSVMLNESKVTERHATLTIQVNEEDDFKLNVWLMGLNSTNGTYQNKKLLPPQTSVSCNNNDIIKIGAYELLLMLFDANVHGLKTMGNFVPKYENGGDMSFDYPDRSASPAKGTMF